MDLDLKSILNSKTRLSRPQIEYIVKKTGNQADYIFLNYLEQKIIEIHGKTFVKDNTKKIQYIISLILDDDMDEFYKFYTGCLEQYMETCKRDIKAVPGFNILFIVFVHIALKIIRQTKN